MHQGSCGRQIGDLLTLKGQLIEPPYVAPVGIFLRKCKCYGSFGLYHRVVLAIHQSEHNGITSLKFPENDMITEF